MLVSCPCCKSTLVQSYLQSAGNREICESFVYAPPNWTAVSVRARSSPRVWGRGASWTFAPSFGGNNTSCAFCQQAFVHKCTAIHKKPATADPAFQVPTAWWRGPVCFTFLPASACLPFGWHWILAKSIQVQPLMVVAGILKVHEAAWTPWMLANSAIFSFDQWRQIGRILLACLVLVLVLA